MESSTRSASSKTYDDTTARRRIGPWSEEGLPDLSAFEPDTTFFVRAAAGSGKTTALVARMVALARNGAASVADLAAITFTRKAAGEMNARFFRELRRARANVAAGTAEANRLGRALSNAQRTFIGTIHSFCARLLRERPLAAGLPPDFSAGIEEREERDLRDRAWRQYLREVRQEAPDRIDRITRLGLEPDDLTASFEALCRDPDLTPYTAAPDQVPALDPAVDAVRRRLDEWQSLRPEAPPKGRDGVMRALDKAEQMLRYQDLDTPAVKADFLALFDDLVRDGSVPNRTCKVTYWGEAKVEAKTLRDEAIPALVEETIQPVLRPWRAYVHERVMAFVRPAVRRYRRLRRDEGLLTFHDLLLQTRDLLRDRPSVRRAVQEQFPRLLVDEFQDTDPLQAEILFYLASRDPTQTDWRACRPRPGSLFIVGDDKQSIYRFRRADKGVFDEVGRLLEAAGGEAVDLTKNFRSLAPICSWCDRAFGDLFADPETNDLQADYVPFDPQRPASPANTALRRIEIDKVPWNRGTDIAANDAQRIARFIRAAVDDRLDDTFYGAGDNGRVFAEAASYSDFLILTRRKKRLSVYAETLAAHDIPYTVTGSEDLGDADALKAIVDLMTCALRPDDPVACVAYLKGPLVGCSDHDLYRYRRAGGRFDRMHEPVLEAVADALDEALRERILGAFERLRRARRQLRQKRPAVALETIIDEYGVLAGAAHPEGEGDASLQAGAVLRILSIVRTLSARGHDWAEVLEELQRILDGEEAVDAFTLEAGGGAAVRLMNVHQAKGLEAPVVFLADPYGAGGGNHEVTRHVRRATDELVTPVLQGEGHYRRVTHAPLGWHDDSDDAFRALEARHEAAEECRLLYVAATRARNLLVVSTYPEKPTDGPWAPLSPHLDAADVPPLDPPPVDPDPAAEAPAPNVEAAQEEREERLAAGGHPSYASVSVTARVEGEQHGPDTGEDGYGRSFGEAVHRLVERCVRARSSDLRPERIDAVQSLRDAGAETEPDDADRALEMVHAFLDSPLWAEIQEAPVVYPEHPVARRTSETPPRLVRGVIDLLYRRPGGWGLVDLKTDRIEGTAGPVVPDDHPYCAQVRTYVTMWNRLADTPVTRAGLWWADPAQFTALDPDAAVDLA